MAMLDYQRVQFKVYLLSSAISGWWFGTFLIFHNIWDNPSQRLSIFRQVHQPDIDISDIYYYSVYVYIYIHTKWWL